MGEDDFVNWELLYKILITNPIPWGIGYLCGHHIILSEKQKNHATDSILQWANKIYSKIQILQKIQNAQQNSMIIENLLDLKRGLDAWM